MNENQMSNQAPNDATQAALFAQLVMQQTNMAMMLLGRVAHPESGKVYKDIEAPRMFIDQLEMLEAKTKGNLSREESALLKQSLMSLRLAFVDAVDSLNEPGGQKPPEEPQKMEPSAPSTAASTPKAESSAATEDEHRKKFSKKY